MSGFLASVSSAASGGIASSVLGLLRQASWRGVSFEMLDSHHTAGRRWTRFLFPGRDDTLHEDIGSIDGPFEVRGLLIGDDYVRRQKRLQAACQAEGPGTLRHPWLGSIKVVLCEPASFAFDDKTHRLCTVTMKFEVWQRRDTAKPGTLGSLLDAIDTLVDEAREMLADALAPLGDALGVLGLAQSAMARIGSVWDGVLGQPDGSFVPVSTFDAARAASADAAFGAASGPAQAGSPGPVRGFVQGGLLQGDTGLLATAAALPLDQLTGGVVLAMPDAAARAAGAFFGGAVAALLAAVPAAIADAADGGRDSALGPGPLAPDGTRSADPRAAAMLLLATLPRLVPAATEAAPASAILLAARVQALAEATRAASGIRWESRDEALAWRGWVEDAHQVLAAQLVAAGTGPAPVVGAGASGAAWRAVQASSAAWSRDVSRSVGRLAPIRHLVTLAPLSAWEIALAVAGDEPSAIRPAMLDLVARNRIRHPGLVPPGRLEVLVS